MTALAIGGAEREQGAFATLLRGLRLTPEFREGLAVTLLLALVATAGRVVVPVAVQQTIDRGLSGPSPDLGLVRWSVGLAVLALLVTAVANYRMNVRLYRTTENGLAALRTRAFRRVHDLSVLHQAAERRGSLVSRVTSDVDTVSTFMQWGGLLVLVSAAQLLLATVLMLFWSWQLTLVVYACFVPLALAVRVFQRHLQRAYRVVRERVGEMLGAVAESVVGAPVIRAYGVQARTAERIDAAVGRTQAAQVRAQTIAAATFSTGELVAAVATGAVVVAGVLLGTLTVGELVGFLFLVTLFVQPVQLATEVLNEAQNAVAGLRRVLAVLDTPTDVADPQPGRALPDGPVGVAFDGVSFASLRSRVVMVPQDGFLFDATVGDNVRYGRASAGDDDLLLAFTELGLRDWLDALPAGLDTPVGERGEALSVGERQLVAVARAYLADPDLLVLDEATSAVDPATEVRLQRALDSLTRGRTTLAIAHRLSTAEAADEVLVVDAGRVVQRGPHAVLLQDEDGPYARLHASWVAQSR